MNDKFHCIGLVGQPRYPTAPNLHETLYHWLIDQGYSVIIEHASAQKLSIHNLQTASLAEIGMMADLAIIIGGDGNMLGAARILSHYDIKMIGINRGSLGFLTDLNPENAQQQLAAVLNGEYHIEKRFLLEATVYQDGQPTYSSTAINEVVLHPGKVAHMIEFEVYIDDHFAFSQRSDGLIISTPTGSTAYSLSAGGPILMPNLNAITLVPMFPHTLTARPLVVDSVSEIKLCFANYLSPLELSCDSQIILNIKKQNQVIIKRSDAYLHLIHPISYDYFNTLNSKLGWSKKLT